MANEWPILKNVDFKSNIVPPGKTRWPRMLADWPRPSGGGGEVGLSPRNQVVLTSCLCSNIGIPQNQRVVGECRIMDDDGSVPPVAYSPAHCPPVVYPPARESIDRLRAAGWCTEEA